MADLYLYSIVYGLDHCERNTYMLVPVFQVRPPGYFTHISRTPITTPIVSALKKLLYFELSSSSQWSLGRIQYCTCTNFRLLVTRTGKVLYWKNPT